MTEPPCETFVFGLERVPLPAVVTDKKGEILWANTYFLEKFSEPKIPQGKNLSSYVRFKNPDQKEWLQQTNEETAPALVTLLEIPHHAYMQLFGVLVGIVLAPTVSVKSLDANRSSRLPPAGDRVVQAFLFLSEALNQPMAEEELILLFIRVYEDLFPGRLFCIKLFDKDAMGFQQVYANGRLREESHSHVRITKLSQMENELNTDEAEAFLKSAGIWVTNEYLPVFEDGLTGFDIPLYDGSTFFGILNFEYWKNEALLPMDRAVAVPMAYQMCASIRNARLITETTLLKDYLAKILDQAASPVVVINRDRSVVVVNQAMELQTGRSREEFFGKDLVSFVAEAEKDQFTGLLLHVMLGEQKSSRSLRFPHSDGKREANIVFNLAPVLSSENDVEGVILVGQNLSEIRSLQQQIIHSEKLATLGQVAAGVAHEVSNPLTFIAVYANYLQKKLDGVIEPSDVEKIKRIVEASYRIQTFTRELVTYGRPSREKSMLLDVQSLLERALSFCEHLIAQSTAVASLTVEPGIKQIDGIRGHLEQVFVNLITNACHAMDTRGGKIHISARMDGSDWIVIDTTDTGTGILPEYLESVFEPFFTTKPEGLGTGLGLSIVRNILTEHHGEISVVSEPQKGAVFTVRLPAK
jgi:two-component system NtrC family sensor kinase